MICAYGLLVGVAVIIGVKETLELAKLRKQRRSLAVAEYSISPPADGQSFRVSVRALFRDPVYVGTLVISMMTTCIAWAYLSSAPFLVQQVYHLEPWQLANIFVSNAVIGVIHNQIVARMLRGKTSPFTLMLAGALGLVASSGLLIVFAMHNIGVWGIIVPAWLMWMSVITIGNPVSVLALLEHPKEAGTAASFGGTLVTIVAAAVTPLSGMFSTTSPLPMGLMQVSATIGVFAVLFTLMRPSRLPELTP